MLIALALTACSSPQPATNAPVVSVPSTQSAPPPAVAPPAAPVPTPAPGVPPESTAPPVSIGPAPASGRAPAAPNPQGLTTPALAPATFAELPGWQDDDIAAAWPAFLAGCAALRNRAEWRPACDAATQVDARSRWAIRKFFVDRFRPYRVRNADGSAHGTVTGYYEPVLAGSRTRSPNFTVPIHAPPDDLLAIELGDTVPELKDAQARGQRLRGRVALTADGKHTVVPYWTRAELIDSAGAASLKGKELAWLADPIEAFFLHVQGSARIRLDDGRTMRVGYADANGHPYRSIGRWLIDRGELKSDEASMQAIQAWARANPKRVGELLAANPSYIFFREVPGDAQAGPVGTLGVPLTAERSIAVDPRFVPLGAPVFLATTQPLSNQPLRRLVFAQDTGSAIKGAVRADLYFGSGPQAGEQAGRMKQRGELWVLLPKP